MKRACLNRFQILTRTWHAGLPDYTCIVGTRSPYEPDILDGEGVEKHNAKRWPDRSGRRPRVPPVEERTDRCRTFREGPTRKPWFCLTPPCTPPVCARYLLRPTVGVAGPVGGCYKPNAVVRHATDGRETNKSRRTDGKRINHDDLPVTTAAPKTSDSPVASHPRIVRRDPGGEEGNPLFSTVGHAGWNGETACRGRGGGRGFAANDQGSDRQLVARGGSDDLQTISRKETKYQ